LEKKIVKSEELLEVQKDETNKYKAKKDQLKETLKQSEDATKSLQLQFESQQSNLKGKIAIIDQRDQTIIEKDSVILLLQNKLKETQVTLSSNTKTIEELKKSLAEAQKYSFRAILNNRNNAHHP
jgi:hypothetical protein